MYLYESLGEMIIVENRPGASRRLAMAEVKHGAPDGRTLGLLASAAFLILPHKGPRLVASSHRAAISRRDTWAFRSREKFQAIGLAPQGPTGGKSASAQAAETKMREEPVQASGFCRA